MIRTTTIIEAISCDLCRDELDNKSVEFEDFRNIRIGKPDAVMKQVCRKCLNAIVTDINSKG